jgi:hypothetical protein
MQSAEIGRGILNGTRPARAMGTEGGATVPIAGAKRLGRFAFPMRPAADGSDHGIHMSQSRHGCQNRKAMVTQCLGRA